MIVIASKKTQVLIILLLSMYSYSQVQVSGTVSSQAGGFALPGASVLIKGTTIGVATDLDGRYSINISDPNSVLVFSFLGYHSMEKQVMNQQLIDVALVESTQHLAPIEITTGYETVSKRTFTGASSRISEEDLKVEGVIDISRMLEGKAAGITVQNISGAFGSAPKITIRGSSSIFGDTKPLWVIDGIVQEDIINISFADLASGNSQTLLSSAIAGLNIDDISSIEILKDASATSIYGSRAMNGVVVITTKSGKRESVTQVSYNLEQTLRNVPNYNQYDILNSQENMSILREMDEKGYFDLPTIAQNRFGGAYNILAKATYTYDPNQSAFVLRNDPANKNEFLRQYELANTDWFKILFRPNISQNHSISFSGGGLKSSFYNSISYYSDPGWTLADQVQRVTAHVRNVVFVNSKLHINFSLMASARQQKAPGSYDSQQDLYYGITNRDFDINPYSYALNTSRTLRPYDGKGNLEYYRANWAPFNILNELQNNTMNYQVNEIRYQNELNYKLMPQVEYTLNTNARYVSSLRRHNIYEKSNIIGAYNANETQVVNAQNTYLYKDPTDPAAAKVPVLQQGGIQRKYSNELLSFNVRNSLTYRQTLAERHELEGFLGQELRYVDRNSDNFTAYGLQFTKGNSAFTNPLILAKIINDGGSYFEYQDHRERAVAFFGRFAYTYDRRYTGSITGRFDGSNQQGRSPSSRWLPTYTISGKWNAKEEAFLAEVDALSALSLRGSYGLTATAGPATNSLAIFRNHITDRLHLDQRETALVIDDLQNQELTWEKQFETNIGLDLELFDHRIQLATDVYQRKAFDLIDYVRTSGIGGQLIKQGNNANMQTRGIEIALNTINLKSDNFQWSSSLNLSYFNQKITNLRNSPTAMTLVAGMGGNVIGKPRNALYSYVFTGLNSEGLPSFVQKEGEKDLIGGAYFSDNENATDYLKYEGGLEPNKALGFSNTISLKNWSLNIFIVASGGNVVRLYPLYTYNNTDISVFTKDLINRWILPGDESRTNIPVIPDARLVANYERTTITRAYTTYNFSDQRVADGSFVRLKNISLGYEFPDALKQRLKIKKMSLKAMATNPLLLYADKKLHGEDPEFYRTGGVAMPITSQYTLTLNLTL